MMRLIFYSSWVEVNNQIKVNDLVYTARVLRTHYLKDDD